MGLRDIVLTTLLGVGVVGYANLQDITTNPFPESPSRQYTGIPVHIDDAYKNSFCVRQAAYVTLSNGDKLYANIGHATAFIIQSSKNETYVVTNAHVVLSPPTDSDHPLPTGTTLDDIVFTLVDNISDRQVSDDIPLRVVGIEKEKDIGILKLEGKREFFNPHHGVPKLGEPSFFVGYLKGLFKVYELGTISGEIFVIDAKQRLYITSHDSMSGCSGAPVYTFNENSSKLVGILSLGLNGTYSIIVPIGYVDDLMKRINTFPDIERKNLETVLGTEAPLLIDDTIKSNEFINSHKEYKLLEK